MSMISGFYQLSDTYYQWDVVSSTITQDVNCTVGGKKCVQIILSNAAGYDYISFVTEDGQTLTPDTDIGAAANVHTRNYYVINFGTEQQEVSSTFYNRFTFLAYKTCPTVKGKWFLQIDKTTSPVEHEIYTHTAAYNSPATMFSVNFTSGTSQALWQCSGMSFSYYPNEYGMGYWSIYYHITETSTTRAANHNYGTTTYDQEYFRCIDFGEEEQPMDSWFYSNVFTKFFTDVDDQLMDATMTAYTQCKLIDDIASIYASKFRSIKPTCTRILHNTSGTTSCTTNMSSYDLVIFRANPYSSYTPNWYAFPAKLFGTSATIPLQVADNIKYSIFNYTTSGTLVYSSGNSGKLYSVYGIKFPTA